MILYADDTNIFVCGTSKEELINKGNSILKSINDYMNNNLLHINNENAAMCTSNPENLLILKTLILNLNYI